MDQRNFKSVRLDTIIIEPDLQIRFELHEDAVQRYMEILDELPPILLIDTAEGFVLADGFHRVEAARRLGREEMRAELRRGARQDAILLAIRENVRHGEPLSRNERRDAVKRIYHLGQVIPGSAGSKLAIRVVDQTLTAGDIAQMTGLSAGTVIQIIGGLTVREELGAGAPSLADSHFERLVHAPKEHREALANVAAAQGWSERETRSAVAALNDQQLSDHQREALLSGLVHPSAIRREGSIVGPTITAPDEPLRPDGRRETVELPEESLSNQTIAKTLWNVEQAERAGVRWDFYTIGYSQKTIDQFVRVLQTRRLSTLVDVRHAPVSLYKPEFSRDRLREALEAQGIDYVHLPELGVPREVRLQVAATADWDRFVRWYDENVIPRLMDGAMTRLTETARQPMAFMCVEHDPTRCHRHGVALALGAMALRGADLSTS